MVVRPSSSPGTLPRAVATVLLASVSLPVSLAAAALALALAAANLHGLALAAGLASMAGS